jgi:hypothetical protein
MRILEPMPVEAKTMTITTIIIKCGIYQGRNNGRHDGSLCTVHGESKQGYDGENGTEKYGEWFPTLNRWETA